MRLLLLLLACCVGAACGLEGSPTGAPQNGVCLRSLQFEDASARNDFLAANATTIAERFNPPGTLYLWTDSPETMRVAIAAPNCADPADLSPLARTEGISRVGAEFMATFDLQREFAEPSPQLISDDDERACVVVAQNTSTSYSQLGHTLTQLTYGGVRFRQVLGVDSQVFVASDEDCDLTQRFVEAIADELALDDADPEACGANTLRECVRLHRRHPG